MQVVLNQSIMQGLDIMLRKNECIVERACYKSKDYLQSCQEMKGGCKTNHTLSFNLTFFISSSIKIMCHQENIIIIQNAMQSYLYGLFSLIKRE